MVDGVSGESAMARGERGLPCSVEFRDVLPAVAGVPGDAGRPALRRVLGFDRGEQVTVGGVHSPAGTLDGEVQFVWLATVDHEPSMPVLTSRCKLTRRMVRATVFLAVISSRI